jgi:hypothetical protein
MAKRSTFGVYGTEDAKGLVKIEDHGPVGVLRRERVAAIKSYRLKDCKFQATEHPSQVQVLSPARKAVRLATCHICTRF